MSLKVYGIHGRTQAVITIPFNGGRAKLELEFEHGRIGAASLNRPATYSTNDPAKQVIIENSQYFGSLITVIREYKDKKDDLLAAAKAKAAADAAKTDRLAAARAANAAKAAAKKKAVELADGVTPLQGDEQGGTTQFQGAGVSASDARTAGLEKGIDASGKEDYEDHPEITSIEEVFAFLKTRGAKATDLTEDGARAFAAKIGVTFSNFEF